MTDRENLEPGMKVKTVNDLANPKNSRPVLADDIFLKYRMPNAEGVVTKTDTTTVFVRHKNGKIAAYHFSEIFEIK